QHGVELMGISVDSKATLRAWADQEGYDFTLLADFWPHGAVATEYGVFLEEKGFANRATFVIDAKGIIRASFITAPGQARSVDEYGAALAEVLPASVGRPTPRAGHSREARAASTPEAMPSRSRAPVKGGPRR